MNVVIPSNTTHTLKLIPRLYPSDALVLSLFNEATQRFQTVENTYLVTDGNLFLEFDYEFIENSKYQIRITENNEVVYRGKLIATSQTPQDYKLTNNIYYS
jgi:hydroxyacyl-ACP dehydratase HTD2-like protein with hotdog domain